LAVRIGFLVLVTQTTAPYLPEGPSTNTSLKLLSIISFCYEQELNESVEHLVLSIDYKGGAFTSVDQWTILNRGNYLCHNIFGFGT
jgi:hypothetical protein